MRFIRFKCYIFANITIIVTIILVYSSAMQFGHTENYKTVLLMLKCVYESPGSCQNANSHQ